MNRWMKIAYDEAKQGMLKNHGGPFGAVIIKDGKVVSFAHNEVLTTKDPTAHAEINTISKASRILDTYDLSDCILYTTCEPCPMCLGAILWARIPKVYYGATREDAAKGGFDDSEFYDVFENKKNTIDLKQIDREKSNKLFEMWNKKEDSQIY